MKMRSELATSFVPLIRGDKRPPQTYKQPNVEPSLEPTVGFGHCDIF
jgi:hypothetical protein